MIWEDLKAIAIFAHDVLIVHEIDQKPMLFDIGSEDILVEGGPAGAEIRRRMGDDDEILLILDHRGEFFVGNLGQMAFAFDLRIHPDFGTVKQRNLLKGIDGLTAAS